MLPCMRVDQERHMLVLEAFPDRAVPYSDAYQLETVRFIARDQGMRVSWPVFLKKSTIRSLGVSTTTLQALRDDAAPEALPLCLQTAALLVKLAAQIQAAAKSQLTDVEYQNFFVDSSYVARTLLHAFYSFTRNQRWQLRGGSVPGFCIEYHRAGADFFIDLKGTPCLGQGTFSKVYKAVWISMAQNKSALVAKKVSLNQDGDTIQHGQTECEVLSHLKNRRGIISLIAGGMYRTDKWISFMPLYAYTLNQYFEDSYKNRIPRMTLTETLSAIEQWLEGLVAVAQIGVHGDLSCANLLINKKASGEIEAVLSDFGNFRCYGKEECELTTPTFGSPEYLVKDKVTAKLDVWSLGVALHGLFALRWLPQWTCDPMFLPIWAATLVPGWLSKYPLRQETPPFVVDLVEALLQPDPAHRPSAKLAFTNFSQNNRIYRSKADVTMHTY